VGQGFHIIEALRSQSVGLLPTSDQPVAETSTWQHTTLTRERDYHAPTGFEPAIPASDRLQTHALNTAATGTGSHIQCLPQYGLLELCKLEYDLYVSPDTWVFWYDISNCNWVATRWQLLSTHIHTNNTGNVTKQTIRKTTQKYIEQHKKIHRTTQQLGRVRAVPRFCGFYPGICLTTEEKARKNLS